MTVPFWCLLIGVVIPYVLAGVGGAMRGKQLGKVDNENPRAQALELRDGAARAVAAQANAWEALGVFTAAVAVNHFAGGAPGPSAIAAIVWVIARVLHPILYVQNLATARSLSFAVGLFASLALFVLAIMA